MKLSKVGEVGQMRSKRGISTKISIKPETLYFQRREWPLVER